MTRQIPGDFQKFALLRPAGRHNPTPLQRDWYSVAEQPAPAPHLSRPEGCAALRIVLVPHTLAIPGRGGSITTRPRRPYLFQFARQRLGPGVLL